MKKLVSYMRKPLKVLTVAMLMLAMLVSVGYTGQGKIVCKAVPTVQAEQPSPETNLLNPAPAASDQSGGKMAPNKAKHSIPAAFTASPVAYKSATEDAKSNSQPSYDCDRIVLLEIEPTTGRLPNSTSMISSLLGRQFTLVGAKPSGTM